MFKLITHINNIEYLCLKQEFYLVHDAYMPDFEMNKLFWIGPEGVLFIESRWYNDRLELL